jgi:hypothetical protein
MLGCFGGKMGLEEWRGAARQERPTVLTVGKLFAAGPAQPVWVRDAFDAVLEADPPRRPLIRSRA